MALLGTFTRKGKRATVKEIFAHSRTRYTICTSVQNWAPSQGKPPVAVLFKGKKGHIVSDLKKKRDWPPWMHLQAQECGSYRADDVVELLKKSLHYAQDPEESVVVLLDWFKAHRSPEVAQLIKDMGHVLLFHGGGTTGYTQVNDTHLHAALQKLLQLLEQCRLELGLIYLKKNFLKGCLTLVLQNNTA